MEKSILDMKSCSTAKITRVEGGAEFQRKLASLNIRVGKIVQVVSRLPLRGPVIVKVDNTEAAIGRGMASRIFVE